MARSTNMQRLTDQLKARYPGVVIYGIGDTAHKRSASGHNEDDTPGSKPEDEDADNKPEHRAIDVMLGPRFPRAAAWALVAALVTVPANQRRLLYVIFEGSIWRAKGGWKRERYTGSNPHTDHPHVSGEADNDEDGSNWILDVPQEDDMQADERNWLQNAYQGTFFGGPSMGPPVPTKVNAGSNGNAIVDLLQHTRREVDALRAVVAQLAADVTEIKARPPATVTLDAQAAAALGPTVEAAVRKVLGGLDGATPAS